MYGTKTEKKVTKVKTKKKSTKKVATGFQAGETSNRLQMLLKAKRAKAKPAGKKKKKG